MKKFLLAVAALAMVACAAQKENLPLEGTVWKLTKLNGESNPAFEVGDTFTFTLDDSKVYGLGSVNRFFGSYEVTGDNGFKFGDNMGMTRMMGENIELEDAFMKMLSEVDGYTVKGDVLTFTKGGESVAEFTGKAPEKNNEDNAEVNDKTSPVVLQTVPVMTVEEAKAMQAEHNNETASDEETVVEE
ncbi:MAG: META domain-containing protein [Alistipes sp.]|nr:META domain-containing protein [Alistipes sp.]